MDQALSVVNETVQRFDSSARDQQNAVSEIKGAVEAIRSLGLDVKRSTAEQNHGSALITNAVTEGSALVGEILDATQAQTKSSEEIEHALEVFRDVADETNRRVGAMNEMISMLSDRSRRLADEIGRFRTR